MEKKAAAQPRTKIEKPRSPPFSAQNIPTAPVLMAMHQYWIAFQRLGVGLPKRSSDRRRSVSAFHSLIERLRHVAPSMYHGQVRPIGK